MPSNLEVLKELLPYEQLAASFTELFVNEYGLPKACDIDKDVEMSAKAKQFLADSLYNRKRYNHISFITIIQTGRRFLFKKAEVICFASLLLLEKWRTEVGDDTGLSDEGYLKKIFFDIIAECDKYKTHVSGKPNLFERYNAILLNIQGALVRLTEMQSDHFEDKQVNDSAINVEEPKKNTKTNEWDIDSAVGLSAADDLPF
jgi:hypothetical protein